MSAKLLKLGMESIDFQSGLLHTELTGVVERLRKDATYTTEVIQNSGFSEIVKRHTGLSISLMIKKNLPGAFIELPRVDKNHPFVTGHLNDVEWRDARSAIKLLNRDLKGSVNRASGKVSGDFSRFETRLWADLGLVNNDAYLKPSEVAAIFLHEIGHIFAYFEYLGYTYRTNIVLSAIARGFTETKNTKERQMILKESEKVLGIEYNNIEKLAGTETIDSIEVITLTETARRMRSELGENLYNVRNFEQLADEFAARHGAARDSAVATEVLYRHYGDKSTLNVAVYLMLEAIKVCAFVTAVYFTSGIATLIAIAAYPQVSSYDDPHTRVEKFKNQLVMRLKDRSLPDAVRDGILEDIRVIENVMAEVKNRRTFYEFLVETVVPPRRRMRQQNEIHVELERLASNDLYVSAAKFLSGAANNA